MVILRNIKMKVAITNPPWPGDGFGARTNVRWPHRRWDKCLAFPIYLAYASALLKEKGFDVFAVDAVEKEWGIFEFVSKLSKEKPDVILLEVSTPSIANDLETAQLLKKELPDSTIVFWGPHATYFHMELMKDYNFIDVCIRGELEHTLYEICRALKDNKPLGSVNGITLRKSGEVIANKDADFIQNLDELPFPDRKAFRMQDYRQAFYSGKRTALIISSRGCPYQCTFCLWPKTVGGRRFRPRSAKNVVDEIEFLVKKYGVDEIVFDDDTFTLDKKRVMDICSEILSRNLNIKWLCMARVNTVDEEVLTIMKKSGCYQVTFGFESGSEKILKSMKKGVTKKEIARAVELTKKQGLVVTGSFVFGMPEENRETVKQTMKFAKQLNADYVQFVLAAPFPGTEFFDFAKEKGLLSIDSWSDLDGTKGLIAKTLYLNRNELQGLIRKAYLSYYTSPKVIYTNLKNDISNHNPKRLFKGAKSILSRIFYYKK